MLYKKKRMVGIVLAGIILLVWGWCVYDINRRLPKAQYIEYTVDSPANVNGLSIKPIESKIYTTNEFKSAYPDYHHYDEWQQNENVRLVVYELELENMILDDILFRTIYMEAFEIKSCWSNGITVIEDGKNSIIISPGQKEKVHVVAYIGEGRMTKRQLNELKSENVGLALSYYPKNIVLRF